MTELAHSPHPGSLAAMARSGEFRLDDSPAMVWATDASGKTIYTSRALSAFVGADRPGFTWTDAIHPDEREARVDALNASIATGAAYAFEYRLLRADGVYCWVDAVAEPRFNDDGEFDGYVGILHDITRWKGAELNQQFLQSLDQIFRAEAGDIDHVFGSVVEKLRSWTESQVCSLSEIDCAQDRVVFRADSRPEGHNQLDSLPLSRYLTADSIAAAKQGRPLVFEDTLTDPRTAAHYRDRTTPPRFRSFILAPYLKDGEWTGLLVLARSRPGPWREDEVALVEAVANRVWTATEKAAAEGRRAELERLHQTLLDTLPAFVVIAGPELEPFYLNPYATEITGITLDNLHSLAEQDPPFFHPEDLPSTLQQTAYHSALRGEYQRGRVRLYTLNGGYRWFDIISQPVLDEQGQLAMTIMVALDVDDHQRAQDALNEQARMLRLATEAGAIGVWSIDYTTDEISATDEFYSIFGLEPGTPLSVRTLRQHLHPESAGLLALTRRSAHEFGPEERLEEEGRIIRTDGSTRWVTVSGETLDNGMGQHQQAVGAAGVVMDITDQKQLLEDLRKANAIKDEFLALVSHELRTPLTTLVGMSRLLRRRLEVDDPEIAGIMDQMVLDSARLQMLVENMLVLSRLDYENISLEPLLLQHLIGRVVSHHTERYPQRELITTIEPNLEPVEGHAGWFSQILENLLSNAEKYSPTDQPIEVTTSMEENLVWVHVQDRGAGISDADIARIFEPFYRAEATANRQPGAGIGLTVCKRLAELQHGAISVRRREDTNGSCFSVGLPVSDL